MCEALGRLFVTDSRHILFFQLFALRGVLAAWMSILGVALLLAAFALSAQGGTDAPTPEGANGDPLPVAPTHREGPP